MKIIQSTLIILTALFLLACSEKFDIEIDDQKFAKLVVEGQLTTDEMEHIVTLKKTSSYFDNQSAERVSNADIFATSDHGDTIIFTETSVAGVYKTLPGISGKLDVSYHLNIQLEQQISGESTYRSELQKMNPVASVDSIQLVFHPEWDNIWEIKIYAYDPVSVDFYMFLAYKNEVLVTDTINEFIVQDDILFNGNYTHGIGSQFLDDDTEEQHLEPGDMVTFEICGISEKYYKYVLQVQTELMGQNPMFGGPPANVAGNMNNGALGFFNVYSTKRSSTLVD
jgi:hypothetical protein